MWSMADKWQNFQNFHGKTEVVDLMRLMARADVRSEVEISSFLRMQEESTTQHGQMYFF